VLLTLFQNSIIGILGDSAPAVVWNTPFPYVREVVDLKGNDELRWLSLGEDLDM